MVGESQKYPDGGDHVSFVPSYDECVLCVMESWVRVVTVSFDNCGRK